MSAQQVLTIDRSAVEALYEKSGFLYGEEVTQSTLNAVREFGRFVDRSVAEKSYSLVQIIATSYIRNEWGVFSIRRSTKSSRREIRSRFTIVLGGHVDLNDDDVEDPVLSCAERELIEEIGIIRALRTTPVGLVADAANAVGRLHLGVVYEVFAMQDFVEMKSGLDDVEFVNRGRRRTIEFTAPETISRIVDFLDPWSQCIVKSGWLDAVFSPHRISPAQRELPLAWRTLR